MNSSTDAAVMELIVALALVWLSIMAMLNIILLVQNIPRLGKIFEGRTRHHKIMLGRAITRKSIFGPLENTLDYWVVPHQIICIIYLKVKARLF